jgi:hypothetical protein
MASDAMAAMTSCTENNARLALVREVFGLPNNSFSQITANVVEAEIGRRIRPDASDEW